MLDRDRILTLVPHAGRSCLLDRMIRVSDREISCAVAGHRDPANPLRARGRLSAVCGVEMGLQAAALHGALRGRAAATRPGYLASLRDVSLHVADLDAPEFGELEARASLEAEAPAVLLYGFSLLCARGTMLVEGRAAIVLRGAA